MKKVKNGHFQQHTIGNTLRAYRIDNDLTQIELAEKLGINIKRYRNYERDKSPMTVDDAIAIANFYDISLEILLRSKPFWNYDTRKVTGLNDDSIARLKENPIISQLLNIILGDENISSLFFGAIQYYVNTPVRHAIIEDHKAIYGTRELLPPEFDKENAAWTCVEKYFKSTLQRIAHHYNDEILMPALTKEADAGLKRLNELYQESERLRIETDNANNGVDEE